MPLRSAPDVKGRTTQAFSRAVSRFEKRNIKYLQKKNSRHVDYTHIYIYYWWCLRESPLSSRRSGTACMHQISADTLVHRPWTAICRRSFAAIACHNNRARQIKHTVYNTTCVYCRRLKMIFMSYTGSHYVIFGQLFT